MTEQELTLIVGRLEGKFETFENTISHIDAKLDNLPCIEHTTKVTELIKWKQSCNGTKQIIETEKIKGSISFKYAFYLALTTGVLGIAITILVNLITTGKP